MQDDVDVVQIFREDLQGDKEIRVYSIVSTASGEQVNNKSQSKLPQDTHAVS